MFAKKVIELVRPNVSPEAKISGVGMFFGRILDSFEERLNNLEARQLQKGDKGDRGEQGPKGKDGKDGLNGINGINGLDGKPGKDGRDGKDGKNGVSVVDAEIAADDHLVLKLSNGNIIDAGPMPEAQSSSGSVFVSGNGYQITVSSTAPSNPQLNDLWLDIS